MTREGNRATSSHGRRFNARATPEVRPQRAQMTRQDPSGRKATWSRQTRSPTNYATTPTFVWGSARPTTKGKRLARPPGGGPRLSTPKNRAPLAPRPSRRHNAAEPRTPPADTLTNARKHTQRWPHKRDIGKRGGLQAPTLKPRQESMSQEYATHASRRSPRGCRTDLPRNLRRPSECNGPD